MSGSTIPLPISPVGGNTGTTLGQQRMIAFQAAAGKWGATLASNLPIRISASWTPMPCYDFAAVLGSAGPTGIYKDFQGAPAGARWYPKALANKLAGADMAPTNVDIEAILNVNVGQAWLPSLATSSISVWITTMGITRISSLWSPMNWRMAWAF